MVTAFVDGQSFASGAESLAQKLITEHRDAKKVETEIKRLKGRKFKKEVLWAARWLLAA